MQEFLKKINRDLEGKIAACLKSDGSNEVKEAPPLASPASHEKTPITYAEGGTLTYAEGGTLLYKGKPYKKAFDIYPDAQISMYSAAIESFLQNNPDFVNSLRDDTEELVIQE